MRVKINDLSHLLTNVIKPVVGFIKASVDVDPILKLSAGKKLTVECSAGDRGIVATVPAEIEEKGTVYLLSTTITTLKTSYKKSILTTEKDSLKIMSADRGRRLSIDLSTTGSGNYTPFVAVSKANDTEISTSIDVDKLQKYIGKIGINPQTLPGSDSVSLISISSAKGVLKILIQDSFRTAFLVQKTKDVAFESELISDYKEFTKILNLLSSMATTATLGFTKKVLSTVGYDDKGKAIVHIRLNHNVPKINIMGRAKEIVKADIDKKALIEFSPKSTFKEGLESAFSMGSATGCIDLKIKKGKYDLTGAIAFSKYTESISLSPDSIVGQGSVRVGSSMLQDVTRLMSEDTTIKVTDRSFIIKSKKDGGLAYFFLPFLDLTLED